LNADRKKTLKTTNKSLEFTQTSAHAVTHLCRCNCRVATSRTT